MKNSIKKFMVLCVTIVALMSGHSLWAQTTPGSMQNQTIIVNPNTVNPNQTTPASTYPNPNVKPVPPVVTVPSSATPTTVPVQVNPNQSSPAPDPNNVNQVTPSAANPYPSTNTSTPANNTIIYQKRDSLPQTIHPAIEGPGHYQPNPASPSLNPQGNTTTIPVQVVPTDTVPH